MKNRFILSLFILVVFLGMFSASCFAAEKILFALMGPMTMDQAAAGLHMEQGAKLAVKEINESGGVNGKEFEYIVGDDQANANQAVIVAQKFVVNDDILCIVGPNNSGCAMSSLPIYEKAGIPMIAPLTTSAALTRLGHKNFVRIIMNDDILANKYAEFVVKELGFKNIAVFWENSDFGKGASDTVLKAIPELGGKVVGNENFVPELDKDFSSQITKFKGLGVDAVLMLCDYTPMALMATQSKKLGFDAQIVTSTGGSDSKFIEIAGEAAEGVLVAAAFDPYDQRPKQAAFIKAFQANFNHLPSEWSAHTYDAVYVLKKAIEMGGTTREKLIEALFNPNFEYDGVTGLIKFNEYGDVSGKLPIFLKVENGKYVHYNLTKM